MAAKRSEEHKSLMRRFLRAVEDYSDEEVADRTRINRESVRKYRKGEWTRLTAETVRKMEDYLGERDAARSPTYAEGRRDTILEVRKLLEEMWVRLRQVSDAEMADDLDEAFRALRQRDEQFGENGGGGGS